jgi:hypothetical protein
VSQRGWGYGKMRVEKSALWVLSDLADILDIVLFAWLVS